MYLLKAFVVGSSHRSPYKLSDFYMLNLNDYNYRQSFHCVRVVNVMNRDLLLVHLTALLVLKHKAIKYT